MRQSADIMGWSLSQQNHVGHYNLRLPRDVANAYVKYCKQYGK